MAAPFRAVVGPAPRPEAFSVEPFFTRDERSVVVLKFMEKMGSNSPDDQVTIQAPVMGGLPALRDSGFGALDSEARSQSYDNLAAAAYSYAGVYFVAFWISWAISSHIRGETFTWPETQFTMAAAPSIAMALIVARTVRKHRLPAESFTRIAQVFLVLSCWGIAQNLWGWQFITGITSEFGGVHWIGVWIISFAAIVTLTPGMILRAGVLSSLTIPAVTLASVLILGFPPGLEATGWALMRNILLSIMTPVWICVGIAYIIAARVFHLAKDASTARRLGSYQLEEKLGAGGMGEVWRAGHRMLARPAAIKLIREQVVASSSGASARTVL
ncbi:MAG: hypothetical protein OEU26_18325, partial [Candidatus Tectomicrobia bacterium]|nr:hypothetical protein [Candidatus Tectomicrobia bacterium]